MIVRISTEQLVKTIVSYFNIVKLIAHKYLSSFSLKARNQLIKVLNKSMFKWKNIPNARDEFS